MLAALIATFLVPLSDAATAGQTPPERHAAAPLIVPRSGHFHPLAAPKRLVAGVHVAPHATKTLRIGGHAGVPTHGVRAVALTLTARSSKPARVWIGSGGSRPAVPTVSAPAGGGSAFAIVPTSATGGARLWNAGTATNISVDVVGWFSRSAESGSAGLLRRLAGATIYTAKIPGGAHRAVKVLGKVDVPKSHVQAILARVTAVARRAGIVSLASSASGSAGTASLSYGKSGRTDLAMSKLKNGKLDVRNRGSAPVTVRIAAVAWFTDGRRAHQFGDALSVSSSPGRVLTSRRLSTAPTSVLTAGARGVPAETSSIPPSFALWRTALRNVSRTSTLSVGPDGPAPADAPSLELVAAQPLARTVLAPPGPAGKARLRLSSGKAVVDAEQYAWFAGSTVISDHARVLPSVLLSDLSDVSAHSVTFTGHPARLADLAVGDILAGGFTAHTPHGLLRTVSSIDTSGTDTIIGTTKAAVADAVTQGSFSVGNGATPTVAQAQRAIPAVPRSSARRSTGCGVDGDVLSLQISAYCTVEAHPGTADVQVTAGVSAALTLTGSIGFGDAYMSAEFRASASVEASASASATASISATASATPWTAEPITIFLGEFPLVIEPSVTLDVSISGSIGGGFTSSASVGETIGVVCDTFGDCGKSSSHHADATGSDAGGDSTQLQASIGPNLNFEMDGTLTTSVGMSFSLNLGADQCEITVDVSVDVNLSVSVKVFSIDWLSLSYSTSYNLANEPVASLPLRNCAVWSGTFNFKSQLHWSGDHVTDNSHGSSSMKIDSIPGGRPPDNGAYTISGSGSGAEIQTASDDYCGPDAGLLTAKDTYNWSGNIENLGGGTIPLSVMWSGTGRKFFADLGAANGQVQVPNSTETSKGYATNGEPPHCHSTVSTQDDIDWTQDVFQLFERGATADSGRGRLTFKVPLNSNTSTGTISFPSSGNLAGYTLTWSLTKKCLKGGTKCT